MQVDHVLVIPRESEQRQNRCSPSYSMQQRKSSFRIEKTRKLCLAPNPEVANGILTQVEISLKHPFEVLTASTSATSYYMYQMTQLQSKNSEKSSKSYKKILTKYQKYDFGRIERRRDH